MAPLPLLFHGLQFFEEVFQYGSCSTGELYDPFILEKYAFYFLDLFSCQLEETEYFHPHFFWALSPVIAIKIPILALRRPGAGLFHLGHP